MVVGCQKFVQAQSRYDKKDRTKKEMTQFLTECTNSTASLFEWCVFMITFNAEDENNKHVGELNEMKPK